MERGDVTVQKSEEPNDIKTPETTRPPGTSQRPPAVTSAGPSEPGWEGGNRSQDFWQEQQQNSFMRPWITT